MSDFFGLRIALSALQAQRRALDVTGHNVANANTPGYSRQRVDLVAESGPTVAAIHSRWRGAGQGVRAAGVLRIRDLFLERRAHQELAVKASLTETNRVLGRIELAFGEPGDSGLAAQIADFFAGWDDLANHPDDPATRAQLLERARTVVGTFHQTATALEALRADSVSQATALVDEVNSVAHQVAELNGAVQRAETAGLPSADLADQRDVLVQRLAELTGATARPGENGVVDVYIGGSALVRGTHDEQLAIQVAGGGGAQVTWPAYGHPATAGGEIGGLLGAANEVLPRYLAQLQDVAGALHDEVNALHQTGFDAAGDPAGQFFTMTAGTIDIDPAVAADPSRIAASASGAALDGTLAQSIAELTGATTRYREMVVGLGVEAQAAGRRLDMQSGVVVDLETARESVAGVNLDEEMVNMLSFQRAYEAGARFMTAVDEAIDTLINGTGVVGR